MKNILKTLALVSASLLAGNALLAESVTLINNEGHELEYNVFLDGAQIATGKLANAASVAVELSSGSIVLLGHFGTIVHHGDRPVHFLSIDNVQAGATLEVTPEMNIVLTGGSCATQHHGPIS